MGFFVIASNAKKKNGLRTFNYFKTGLQLTSYFTTFEEVNTINIKRN